MELQQSVCHPLYEARYLIEWVTASSDSQDAFLYEGRVRGPAEVLVRRSTHIAVHHSMRLAEVTSTWHHEHGFEFSYLSFEEAPLLANYIALNRRLVDHLAKAIKEGIVALPQ
jgi:hypothetical protein